MDVNNFPLPEEWMEGEVMAHWVLCNLPIKKIYMTYSEKLFNKKEKK